MTNPIVPTPITELPPAPLVTDTPEQFDDKAFPFAAALDGMRDGMNSAASATYQNAVASNERAAAAQVAQGVATTEANRATAQAGIATTKAGEASASASQASIEKNLAQQAVADAAVQVGLAAAQAVRAEDEADRAQETVIRAVLSYPDYAAASAAAATLPDGQPVVSEYDEVRGVVNAGAIAQEQSIYAVADYAKIRSYTGRGTRLRVVDPTGAHWWVRNGTRAEDGALVLKDALARSWEREFSGNVNAVWFGVIAGVTSPLTSQIQAALDCTKNRGLNVDFPAGTLHFDGPLLLESGGNGVVEGKGRFKTILQYIGEDSETTFLTITRHTCAVKGLGFNSNTDMTSGSCIFVDGVGDIDLSDVACGHPHTNPVKLWDGIVYSGTNMQFLNNFTIRVKNRGLVIYGEGAGSSKTHYDLWANNGKISRCSRGIVIGGGFDNAYFDNIMCTYNDINVTLNSTLSDKPFQNITFGYNFVCEWSQNGPGFYIDNDQPAINSSVLVINAHVQDNKTTGISVVNFPNGNLIINSPHISSNKSHGISIADASVKLHINKNTVIKNNGGYGVWAYAGKYVEMPDSVIGNALGGFYNARPISAVYRSVFKDVANVAASGVDQSTAVALISGVTVINADSTEGGCVLLGSEVNSELMIINRSSKEIKVYPPVGQTFYGFSANSPIKLKHNTTIKIIRLEPTAWLISNYANLSDIKPSVEF